MTVHGKATRTRFHRVEAHFNLLGNVPVPPGFNDVQDNAL